MDGNASSQSHIKLILAELQAIAEEEELSALELEMQLDVAALILEDLLALLLLQSQ